MWFFEAHEPVNHHKVLVQEIESLVATVHVMM